MRSWSVGVVILGGRGSASAAARIWTGARHDCVDSTLQAASYLVQYDILEPTHGQYYQTCVDESADDQL